MPNARDIYRDRSERALPPRDVEAAAFEFVIRGLQSSKASGDGNQRVQALSRNRKLWSLLLTDLGMTGNALPDVLRQDLVTIGCFSVQYSIKAMLSDLDLDPLIAINRDMIEALRSGPVPSHAAKPALMAAATRMSEPLRV